MKVSAAVHHDLSAPLFLLAPRSAPPARIEHEPRPFRRLHGHAAPVRDPALQSRLFTAALPPPVTTYEGVGDGFAGPAGTFSVTGTPPDSDGDVGPNHYLSLVNSGFAVLSKTTGAALFGPVSTSTLFAGFGGQCEQQDDGDGVVLYDPLADRWFLTQFAVSAPDPSYYQCVAVSKTADPTGQWYRYAFPYVNFNDYGKFGVWPDAYYATYNSFDSSNAFAGALVCAFDRTRMLQGAEATQQCVQLSPAFGGLLPADLDGLRAPPAGEPGFIVGFGTDANGNGAALQLWKFHVDWDTPANTTLGAEHDVAVAAFTQACVDTGTCIVQPPGGTTQKLDALADRLMFRLAYRNLGDHEALVVNHTVVAGNSTGVRWYELRDPAGTPSIFQQGTFAPDGSYRWMGSVAMDKAGDLAMGYSVSSATLEPSINYTGRLPGDPLGAMAQGEGLLFAGTGSEIGSGSSGPITRWGDYSNLSVDPADDCTFWFIDEYVVADGIFNWHTRIGTFKFPGCVPPANDFSLSVSPASGTVHGGQTTTLTVNTALLHGAAEPISLRAQSLPAGVTGSFNPATVLSGASSTLTLTAAQRALATSLQGFTVVGAAPSAAHLASAQLTVVRNDFSLTLAPVSQQLFSGASATYAVATAVVSGDAEAIALSLDGLPGSITGSFLPATVTAGQSSTLTIHAAVDSPSLVTRFNVTGTALSSTQIAAGEAVVPAAFTLSATPSAVLLANGHTVALSIATARVSGNIEPLALSAAGLPAGVTAAFVPPSVQTGESTVLTLTAAQGAAQGLANFTVHAEGSATAKDAAVALTVSANQFALAVTPAAATLVAGGSVVLTVTAQLISGQAEAIALSVGGLPPSVSGSFNPVTVQTGGTSKLTLTALPNVAADNASIVVSGTGPSGAHSAGARVTTLSQPVPLITSPLANAVVSGLVQVSALTRVSPGTVLAKVQLFVEDQPAGAPATGSPAVIPWDSTKVTNGPHLLSLRATDAAGTTSSSPALAVDVENGSSGCGSTSSAGGVESLGLLGLFAAVVRKRRRRPLDPFEARGLTMRRLFNARLLLAGSALLTACGRDLAVPPPVAPPQVVIDGFMPAHAYAGAQLVVTGKRLGQSVSEVLVRVGGSRPVAPVSTSADGTSVTIEVPDDATSGPVSVTAPLGQAITAASFAFDGAGRLAFGRVAKAHDLSLSVIQAAPLQGADFAFLDFQYGRAALSVGGVVAPLPVAFPIGLSVDSTGQQLVVLDHDVTPDPAPGRCTDPVGHVTLFVSGTPTRFCLPNAGAPAVSTALSALAIDNPPTHAVAFINDRAWLVDLTGPGAQPIAVDGAPIQPVAAWMGGSKFLTIDAQGLRQIDWTQTPALQPALAIDAGFPSALAAQTKPHSPGGKQLVVVGDVTGPLYLYDLLNPGSAVVLQSYATANGFPSAAAFSPDGTRLGVANYTDGRFVTYDLTTEPPQVVQLASLNAPQEIVAALGLFYVGVRSGVAQVAQRSGSLVQTVPLIADLRTPRVHKAPAGLLGAHGPYVIELASHLFGSNTIIDETSGFSLQGAYRPALADVPLDGLEAVAATTAILARHGNTVHRVLLDPADHETEDKADLLTLEPGTDRPPRLRLSSDGSVLLLAQQDSSHSVTPDRVLLLDPAKPFPAAGSSVPFLQDNLLGEALLDSGRVVLVTEDAEHGDVGGLALYDAADLLAGKKTLVKSVALAQATYRVGTAAGRIFAVVKTPLRGVPHLAIVTLATGALTLGDPLPGWDLDQPDWQWDDNRQRYLDDFVVAPSGTRLYQLAGRGAERRLNILRVQPDTGAARGEDPPVPLPPGASDLLLAPDGLHLYVVDTEGDLLLQLE